MSSIRWTWSEDREFLAPIDIYLCKYLLLRLNETPKVLEIGLWKGGFQFSLIQNFNKIEIVGIDPYPGLEKVKDEFLRKVTLSQANVRLFPSIDDCEANVSTVFDLIHVDGEHSERAVLSDLEFAEKYLAATGIIVVDDIWHPSFPGIASAVFRKVHSSQLTPFLISGAKIYLCREASFDMWHKSALEILSGSGLSFSTGFKMGLYGETYLQKTQ